MYTYSMHSSIYVRIIKLRQMQRIIILQLCLRIQYDHSTEKQQCTKYKLCYLYLNTTIVVLATPSHQFLCQVHFITKVTPTNKIIFGKDKKVVASVKLQLELAQSSLQEMYNTYLTACEITFETWVDALSGCNKICTNMSAIGRTLC